MISMRCYRAVVLWYCRVVGREEGFADIAPLSEVAVCCGGFGERESPGDDRSHISLRLEVKQMFHYSSSR